MKMLHYFNKEKGKTKKHRKKRKPNNFEIFIQPLRFTDGEMQVQEIYAQYHEGASSAQKRPFEKS